MSDIKKGEVGQFTVSGTFDIQAKVSPDNESKRDGLSKTFTLRFKMNSVPLEAIIASSLKDKRINAQIPLRSKFELYKDGQVIELDYEGAGRLEVNPLDKIILAAKAAGMSVEEYIKAELAKR